MNFKSRFDYIYNTSPLNRIIILWIAFQLLMWLIFGLSFLLNKDAWINVIEVERGSAAVGGFGTTFLFIMAHNLLLCAFIAIGNFFVRFGKITPGLMILFLQAISIGWLAGSNGFEAPFVSVTAANIQYLKIGIWETTAYVIICAVTLPKSLYISNTFPAKKWNEIKTIKDIVLNKREAMFITISIIILLTSAVIEALALV